MDFCHDCGQVLVRTTASEQIICQPCGLTFCCGMNVAKHYSEEHPDIWLKAIDGRETEIPINNVIGLGERNG